MDNQEYTDKLNQLKGRRRSRRKVNLLLRTYSWMGVFLAIIAGGYFLSTLFSFELTSNQRLALMMAGVGLLLSLMSTILINFYRAKDADELYQAEEQERLADFLAAWAQFERVSKRIMAQDEDQINIYSLRSVISRLHTEGIIDEKDVVVLEEGLRTRNSIVHGEHPMSARATERTTDSLVEIIRKIPIPT